MIPLPTPTPPFAGGSKPRGIKEVKDSDLELRGFHHRGDHHGGKKVQQKNPAHDVEVRERLLPNEGHGGWFYVFVRCFFGGSGWGFEAEGYFLWWFCLDVVFRLMEEQKGCFGCGG